LVCDLGEKNLHTLRKRSLDQVSVNVESDQNVTPCGLALHLVSDHIFGDSDFKRKSECLNTIHVQSNR